MSAFQLAHLGACELVFSESSAQQRGAELGGAGNREEEKGDEKEEGVELVQMSKTNNKLHQQSTIEFSTF